MLHTQKSCQLIRAPEWHSSKEICFGAKRLGRVCEVFCFCGFSNNPSYNSPVWMLYRYQKILSSHPCCYIVCSCQLSTQGLSYLSGSGTKAAGDVRIHGRWTMTAELSMSATSSCSTYYARNLALFGWDQKGFYPSAIVISCSASVKFTEYAARHFSEHG